MARLLDSDASVYIVTDRNMPGLSDRRQRRGRLGGSAMNRVAAVVRLGGVIPMAMGEDGIWTGEHIADRLVVVIRQRLCERAAEVRLTAVALTTHDFPTVPADRRCGADGVQGGVPGDATDNVQQHRWCSWGRLGTTVLAYLGVSVSLYGATYVTPIDARTGYFRRRVSGTDRNFIQMGLAVLSRWAGP